MNLKNNYCDFCNDKICEKCVEFPWQCPEYNNKFCKACLEELEILKKLYLKYQKGEIEL